MEGLNQKLKSYIENKVFPMYEKNDLGHGLIHIEYVINRSLKFAKKLSGINIDIVYTIAAFHDIGHFIDKENHEIISAEIFYKNDDMKDFFTIEERIIIKEAIEDHRASLGHEPRSIYGKIVSSADRETDVNAIIKKTHNYSLKHFSNMSLDEMINRAYEVLKERIDNEKRYPIYVKDIDYENFIDTMKEYLQQKKIFREKYIEVVNALE